MQDFPGYAASTAPRTSTSSAQRGSPRSVPH